LRAPSFHAEGGRELGGVDVGAGKSRQVQNNLFQSPCPGRNTFREWKLFRRDLLRNRTNNSLSVPAEKDSILTVFMRGCALWIFCATSLCPV
jgi:hypothetical protein